MLAWVAPDGFPLAVRLPVRLDAGSRQVEIGAEPAGVPLVELPGHNAQFDPLHPHGLARAAQAQGQRRAVAQLSGNGLSPACHGPAG